MAKPDMLPCVCVFVYHEGVHSSFHMLQKILFFSCFVLFLPLAFYCVSLSSIAYAFKHEIEWTIKYYFIFNIPIPIPISIPIPNVFAMHGSPCALFSTNIFQFFSFFAALLRVQWIWTGPKWDENTCHLDTIFWMLLMLTQQIHNVWLVYRLPSNSLDEWKKRSKKTPTKCFHIKIQLIPVLSYPIFFLFLQRCCSDFLKLFPFSFSFLVYSISLLLLLFSIDACHLCCLFPCNKNFFATLFITVECIFSCFYFFFSVVVVYVLNCWWKQTERKNERKIYWGLRKVIYHIDYNIKKKFLLFVATAIIFFLLQLL